MLLFYSDTRVFDLLKQGIIGFGGFDEVQNITTEHAGNVLPAATVNFRFYVMISEQTPVDTIQRVPITITPNNDNTKAGTVTVPPQEN